jgi:hypothetical protein
VLNSLEYFYHLPRDIGLKGFLAVRTVIYLILAKEQLTYKRNIRYYESLQCTEKCFFNNVHCRQLNI